MKTRYTLYPRILGFRVSTNLQNELTSLAAKTQFSESEILRRAAWAFIDAFKDTPDELRNMI